jgi:hypothetical protein
MSETWPGSGWPGNRPTPPGGMPQFGRPFDGTPFEAPTEPFINGQVHPPAARPAPPPGAAAGTQLAPPGLPASALPAGLAAELAGMTDAELAELDEVTPAGTEVTRYLACAVRILAKRRQLDRIDPEHLAMMPALAPRDTAREVVTGAADLLGTGRPAAWKPAAEDPPLPWYDPEHGDDGMPVEPSAPPPEPPRRPGGLRPGWLESYDQLGGDGAHRQ